MPHACSAWLSKIRRILREYKLTHILLLQQLSVMQQQAGNEEAFEYNSLLRHGIFEAYSGILNGMSSAKCDQYLQSSAPVCHCSRCIKHGTPSLAGHCSSADCQQSQTSVLER